MKHFENLSSILDTDLNRNDIVVDEETLTVYMVKSPLELIGAGVKTKAGLYLVDDLEKTNTYRRGHSLDSLGSSTRILEWKQSRRYRKDQPVTRNKRLFKANSDIPENTPFMVGSGINKWEPITEENSELSQEQISDIVAKARGGLIPDRILSNTWTNLFTVLDGRLFVSGGNSNKSDTEGDRFAKGISNEWREDIGHGVGYLNEIYFRERPAGMTTREKFFNESPIIDVGGNGYSFMAALKEDGTLWAWGKNGGGYNACAATDENGDKITDNIPTPIKIAGSVKHMWTSLGCLVHIDYGGIVYEDENGVFWGGGSNNHDTLGHGSTSHPTGFIELLKDGTICKGLGDEEVFRRNEWEIIHVHNYMGKYGVNVFVIKGIAPSNKDQLWILGAGINSEGILGYSNHPAPGTFHAQKLPDDVDMVLDEQTKRPRPNLHFAISLYPNRNRNGIFYIKKNGEIWGRGNESFGFGGNDGFTKIGITDNKDSVLVAGSEGRLIWEYNLSLWAVGDNSDKTLGSIGSMDEPQIFADLSEIGSVTALRPFLSGSRYRDSPFIYVDENKEGYVTSSNENGEAGTGTRGNKECMTPLPLPKDDCKIKDYAIYSARDSKFVVLAITEKGSWYAWGNNRGCDLFYDYHGDYRDLSTPLKVNVSVPGLY